ncbi:cadherin-like domain-containing protein [Flavisolibacter tropicus]|uniref:Cadherin-like domain-containing protein n=1 Tax=Flavisolibacter tropicus TaxID=1492898 RepID=A0A172TUD5_9BACT|nr:Ig-like domain-containing protein [Flavisolibacter tropicus]ANE50588.1 hypothetical protein SY85_08805 [Flavisolibacter tropicus]
MRGIFTFLFLTALYSAAHAQTTQGPNTAGLVTETDNASGKISWTTPTNAATDNNLVASVTINQNGANGQSEYLRFSNFGFNVPVGYTVSGVAVTLDSRFTGDNRVSGNIQLVDANGTPTGTIKAVTLNANTFNTVTYGGPSDNWASGFPATTINNTNFGIVLSIIKPNNTNSTTAEVDFASITVYYTNSAPTATNNNYFPLVTTQSVNGNVLTDQTADSDPSNETLTASIDNRSELDASGTFTFNSNGSFNFSPSASFLGGPISFTYHVTDNGTPILSSNIATVTLNYPAKALPVEFISLEANKAFKGVQLTWKVGTEINVVHYEVERSTDGNNYKKIGTVAATQNNIYSFTDLQPVNGLAYYRVRNVDLDGAFKYTTVVKYKNESSVSLYKAFPTTTSTQVTLQHPQVAGKAIITLSSLEGKALRSTIPSQGSVSTQIDLSAYPSGMYLLQFLGENGRSESFRVFKQ